MSHRRTLLLAGSAALLAAPWIAPRAQARPTLPRMTDGPFYPSADWRRGETDWDADLTQTRRSGRTQVARGEPLGLELTISDSRGAAIDGAAAEIWQCDAMAQYRHPRVRAVDGEYDAGFQGFGEAKSGAGGRVGFRTIRPVPYPGRCPHIHVKLRHASFGEISSQLFVAGDPGNARDFLWRSLDAAGQAATAMQLQAAPADSTLRWTTKHAIVLPA